MENQVFTNEELEKINELLTLLDPNKKVFQQSNAAVEEAKTLILTPIETSDRIDDNKQVHKS